MFNFNSGTNTGYTPTPRPSLLQSQTDSCANHGTTATINLITPTDLEGKTPSVSCISPPSSPGLISLANPPESLLITEEEHVLNKNGYNIVQKLSDTQQGQLLEAYVLNADASNSKIQKVIIKKVYASLYSRHIGIAHNDNNEDYGMAFCIPNNILKESLILSHLTVANRQTQIIRFVDFFASTEGYYLVLEHLNGNCMNLKQFVDQAHSYIRNGQLHVARYLQVVKWIFWQLFVLIRHLHNDMHCCHLDLKLEHVMLKDAEFVIDPETSVITISRSIGIKLCDFGSAELFEDGVFECTKRCSILREAQYQSPLLVGRQTYDARKADIWALGSMLFHCVIGQPVYRKYNECHKIEKIILGCLKGNDHLRRCADLILHMLRVDEDERYLSMNVLQHKWVNEYYRKYKHRIAAKGRYRKNGLP
eukprot:36121_1